MKPSQLNDKYFATGNRGHVFVDHEVHIAKKGMDPNTLCGIPMLFTNYVPKDETKDNLGICSHCLDEYYQATGTKPMEEPLTQCPQCNSHDVVSIDNQPLEHNRDLGIDTEIYLTLKCQECKHTYEETFQLVRKTP